MPAGVSIPYTFTLGQVADADQVNANFQALASKFGGIVDGDVAVGADLDGNKLSATAGKRVPETRLENNAASDRVIADDPANPGNDANRGVGGDMVKTLTAAHVARIFAAAAIGTDKLKLTIDTKAFAVSAGAAGIPVTTTVTPTGTYPKADYDCLGVFVKNPLPSGLHSQVSVVPLAGDTGANWSGGVTVIGNAASGGASGTLVYVFLKKVSGA